MERRFCCAKSVACGRVIEHEWGNPSKVPPSHSPFLAMCGSATAKPVGGHKKKHHPDRMVFSFWNAAGRVELAASTGAQRVKPFRRGRRPRRPVSAAVPRWERIPTPLRAAKQVPLGYTLGVCTAEGAPQGADEVSPPAGGTPHTRRRQPPPTKAALGAALARFDNRPCVQHTSPYLHTASAAAAQEVQAIP